MVSPRLIVAVIFMVIGLVMLCLKGLLYFLIK
jgi:preprotein translocase subunit Sec61beta